MSRIIKFRVWHKKHKKMYFFGELVFHPSESIQVTMLGEHQENCFAPADDEQELMQFTGLTDKHGKEIYEGDIIEYNNAECIDVLGRMVLSPVSFHHGNFCFDVLDTDKQMVSIPICNRYRTDDGWQIVGNIYENPDLVKE